MSEEQFREQVLTLLTTIAADVKAVKEKLTPAPKPPGKGGMKPTIEG